MSAILEDQLLRKFHGGLRAKLESRVCTHDPKEITRAINLARDVEELCAFGLSDYAKFQAHMSGHKYPSSSGIFPCMDLVGTTLVGSSNVVHEQASSNVVKTAPSLAKYPYKGVQGC